MIWAGCAGLAPDIANLGDCLNLVLVVEDAGMGWAVNDLSIMSIGFNSFFPIAAEVFTVTVYFLSPNLPLKWSEGLPGSTLAVWFESLESRESKVRFEPSAPKFTIVRSVSEALEALRFGFKTEVLYTRPVSKVRGPPSDDRSLTGTL